MDISELVEISTNTFLGLERIKDTLPKIEEQAELAKLNISKAESDIDSINQAVADAKKVESSIDEKLAQVNRELDKTLKEIEKARKSILDTVKKAEDKLVALKREEAIIDRLTAIEERLDEYEANISDILVTKEEEEEEEEEDEKYYTLNELYDDYGTGVPVVASGWHGDYCYVIDAIVEDKGYGVNFKNGRLMQPLNKRIRIANANEAIYRLYEGPSEETIDKLIQNEDVASFWGNRGFVVDDERLNGSGKYLYVRGKYSDLANWSQVIRQIFDVKGRLYDDYWVSSTTK